MKHLDIQKVNKDWVITLIVPQEQKTFNPYDESEGIMDSICGVIDDDMQEWGFAYLIDMDYKGKPPQWTSNFVDCSGFMDKEEFIMIFETNKITLIQ